MARIKAILRRTSNKSETNTSDGVRFDDIEVFPARQEATCQGNLLDLTTTEFALLHYFVQKPGETLTKEALSLDVLGKRLSAFDRAVDMHVSNLRKNFPRN